MNPARAFVRNGRRPSTRGRRMRCAIRRGVAGAAAILVLGAAGPANAIAPAAEAAPAQVASAFYDALLDAMKQGKSLGFDGRRRLLDPEIRRAFNFPLMTRLVVGLPWRHLTTAQQEELIGAFSEFSVATYASEFKEFSGERFVVEPAPTAVPGGDVIVRTKLFPVDGDPVQLDYLMRSSEGRWQIIDVYLTGTISQLAARRSEFSAVLRQGGAAALVKLLREKSAALSG